MKIDLQIATIDDVKGLVEFRTAVDDHLTAQFGEGFWSSKSTEKGALYGMRQASVYIAKDEGRLIASLTLSTRKPWAVDKNYFSPSKRPLYLTSMAVSPHIQRQGVGRLCIDDSCRIARAWPSDAILLDAYDAPAGAGEFYRKCGFREVGRVVFRNSPLIYFEMAL